MVGRHHRWHSAPEIVCQEGPDIISLHVLDARRQTLTPWLPSNVVFDTAAPFLLLPGNNCTNCGQQHNHFAPSRSDTFLRRPGYDVETFFGAAGGGTVPYVEPQGANCTVVTDTVRLAGRSAPGQEFLLCHSYSTGLRVQHADGIFGLGTLPSGTWPGGDETDFKTAYWQLVDNGQLCRPEFAFSFVGGARNDKKRSGVLTLGGTDPSLYRPRTLQTIPLDWPLSESGNRWVVGVRAARVGRDLADSTSDGVALVDTGAAVVVTPDAETARELYGRMSHLIRPLDDGLGAWGAPCAVLDRAARDVSFRLGSVEGRAVEVVLKREYINVGEYPGKPGICQGVFLSPEMPAREPIRGRPAWILGNPLLRSYYTVWNAAERTLGFAAPAQG